MVDNVSVTAGSGTSIRTDDVGGAHVQYMKLMNGTDAASDVIPGDAANGLDVDVTRLPELPAGTKLIGKVGLDQTTPGTTNRVAVNGGINISATPTITAGGYSAKDAVGGEMTFANAARTSGGSGIINSVTIIDNDDEKAGLELWLFHTTVTEAADNAPMDFSDAELATCVGVIPISAADYYSLADNGVACVRGVGLQFKCAATSLFGQLKCTGTPTYTATSDLTVVLGIEYLD